MTKVTNDTLDFCGLNSDIAATPQQPDTVQITEASISLPENRRSLRCRRVQKDFPRGEASLRTPYSVYHSKWPLGSSIHVAVTIDVAYEKSISHSTNTGYWPSCTILQSLPLQPARHLVSQDGHWQNSAPTQMTQSLLHHQALVPALSVDSQPLFPGADWSHRACQPAWWPPPTLQWSATKHAVLWEAHGSASPVIVRLVGFDFQAREVGGECPIQTLDKAYQISSYSPPSSWLVQIWSMTPRLKITNVDYRNRGCIQVLVGNTNSFLIQLDWWQIRNIIAKSPLTREIGNIKY